MASLAKFLKTGRLGDILLGMVPSAVEELLEVPDRESEKMNPLILTYGSLQLTFWRRSNEATTSLREIAITVSDDKIQLHAPLTLEDYTPPYTEECFIKFMESQRCMATKVHRDDRRSRFVFLSGVVVSFAAGKLIDMRLSQREAIESRHSTTADLREPSRDQIIEMLREAERAAYADSKRAAIMIAWAGLEAALRRFVRHNGVAVKSNATPSVLVSDLYASGTLSSSDVGELEQLRQIRASVAHGLTAGEIDNDAFDRINDAARLLLIHSAADKEKLRIAVDIFAVEAEMYSVILPSELSKSLLMFLQSRGLQGRIDPNVVTGDVPEDAVLIEKSIPYEEFNRRLNEWREQFVNE